MSDEGFCIVHGNPSLRPFSVAVRQSCAYAVYVLCLLRWVASACSLNAHVRLCITWCSTHMGQQESQEPETKARPAERAGLLHNWLCIAPQHGAHKQLPSALMLTSHNPTLDTLQPAALLLLPTSSPPLLTRLQAR